MYAYQHVRVRKDSQKSYHDKGACERDLSIGENAYVSAADRLRVMESCQLVPGRIICVYGVMYTLELMVSRIIVRHAYQDRRRYEPCQMCLKTSFLLAELDPCRRAPPPVLPAETANYPGP